jgi:hypothetical protein
MVATINGAPIPIGTSVTFMGSVIYE